MRVVYLIAFTLWASQSFAQDSIYDRCLAEVGKGNISEVKELASKIKRFSNYGARDLEKAEKCVSFAEGDELMFDGQAFVSKTKVLEERAAKKAAYESKKKAEDAVAELRKRRQKALKALDALNKELISAGIYDACVKLFKQDDIAALTNSVCISSFKVNGHPNLALYDEAFKAIIK